MRNLSEIEKDIEKLEKEIGFLEKRKACLKKKIKAREKEKANIILSKKKYFPIEALTDKEGLSIYSVNLVVKEPDGQLRVRKMESTEEFDLRIFRGKFVLFHAEKKMITWGKENVVGFYDLEINDEVKEYIT